MPQKCSFLLFSSLRAFCIFTEISHTVDDFRGWSVFSDFNVPNHIHHVGDEFQLCNRVGYVCAAAQMAVTCLNVVSVRLCVAMIRCVALGFLFLGGFAT